MAYRLDGTKPLSKPMLEYCHLDPWERTSVKFESEFKFSIQESTFENVVCEMASIFKNSWCFPNVWRYTLNENMQWWIISSKCVTEVISISSSVLLINSSPPDKMSAISQTTFPNAFSWMKSFVFWFKCHLKFVSKCPVDNKWVLIEVMAWRRTGNTPLSEPMLTQFADAYLRH